MFYKSKFFVWCSPVFDPRKLDEYHPYKKIPPSSSPCKIYNTLLDDVKNSDLHSSKIENNKIGLKAGAGIHFKKGTITVEEYARILEIIDKASIDQFRPLLYIIPKALVEKRVIRVAVDKAANPLSEEFQIVDLTLEEFEVIELKEM